MSAGDTLTFGSVHRRQRPGADDMSLVIQEPMVGGISIQFELEQVYLQRRTAYQEVIVADTVAYGRTLFLDGFVQSSSSDECIYHELLIHPALVIHGCPKRVLVGGTGEGASIREILRHPTIERVVTVDIDGEVVELCREYLPEWSAGALDDPRVEARVEDFLETLERAEAGSFDVVVADLTDPGDDGPAHLWSADYFGSIARTLADRGICVVQAGEFDPCELESIRSVYATLREVFPHVRVLRVAVPSFSCLWSFAITSMQPFELCPEDLEARIAKLPREELKVYTPIAHRAAAELPPYLKRLLLAPQAEE